MILVLVSQIEANTKLLYALLHIKMSGSELRPRKVELMCINSKKCDDYCEYFTHNYETCTCSYKSQPYGSDIHSLMVSLRSSLNP